MPSLYYLVNSLANAFLTNLWATEYPPASWRVFSGIFYKMKGRNSRRGKAKRYPIFARIAGQ
jgi:hypothetical protein